MTENKEHSIKIGKRINRFWVGDDMHQMFEITFWNFSRFVRNIYRQGRKDALTDAIDFFGKHKDEPMTGNVVNLELKALRGDYKK